MLNVWLKIKRVMWQITWQNGEHLKIKINMGWWQSNVIFNRIEHLKNVKGKQRASAKRWQVNHTKQKNELAIWKMREHERKMMIPLMWEAKWNRCDVETVAANNEMRSKVKHMWFWNLWCGPEKWEREGFENPSFWDESEREFQVNWSERCWLKSKKLKVLNKEKWS